MVEDFQIIRGMVTQAPGHPFVHGLQASDVDFADLRYSKLVIQVGKKSY